MNSPSFPSASWASLMIQRDGHVSYSLKIIIKKKRKRKVRKEIEEKRYKELACKQLNDKQSNSSLKKTVQKDSENRKRRKTMTEVLLNSAGVFFRSLPSTNC